MSAHSPECESLRRFDTDNRAAWAAAWPNYCRTCEARGTDPEQFSFVPSWLAAGCPDCAGRCPRCAEPLDADTICDGCGWDGDEETTLPEMTGCICDANAPTAAEMAAESWEG